MSLRLHVLRQVSCKMRTHKHKHHLMTLRLVLLETTACWAASTQDCKRKDEMEIEADERVRPQDCNLQIIYNL